jgi:protein required for attachment to host cells
MAVTEWLNAEVLGHRIAHLVVIAAPRTLGEMRRHYHNQLQGVLIAELAKDLSGRSAPEIVAALRARS